MTDQQQVTGNPLDQLREAHGVVLEVLANVRPEQMSLPTPDDEWDVRALINHIVDKLISAVDRDGDRADATLPKEVHDGATDPGLIDLVIDLGGLRSRMPGPRAIVPGVLLL